MTTTDLRAIGNYAIETFIGYGASSVVFKGYDLKCKQYGVTKNVAVKFIWKREMAMEEVRRLQRTQGVFEICDLITYEEVTGAVVRELIGDTLIQMENAMDHPLPIQDDLPVGVLILKLINGEHLIDRTIYHDEPLESGYEWTVDFEHPDYGEKVVLKEWLTDTAQELDLEARLEILAQLTKAIDESHRQGVVHGDLNPWNVFYNREAGRISIIDLGRNNFGVQGWRTTEHLQLMNGEIEVLPKETDIRLLGQWMRYLLPKKGPWSGLVGRCRHAPPDKLPTTKEILAALRTFAVRRPKKRLFLLGSLFTLTLFLGLYAWQQQAPFTLDPNGFNRIAVLPFEGSATGKLVSEMVNKSLSGTEDLTVVRDANTREIAKSLELRPDSDLDVVQRAAMSMGAQFMLMGHVDESDMGSLTWTGTLIQHNGTRRRLKASGQNALILADAISSSVLKLTGSAEIPFPASELYSANLKANFLYSYGNEFYQEGNINAAAPMFEKALEADPKFYWAQARLAKCDIDRGNLRPAEISLNELVNKPGIALNYRLLVTCYEYLASISRQRSDLELAIQYIEEGKDLCEQHGLEENQAYLLSMEAWIKADLRRYEEALIATNMAENIYAKANNLLGRAEVLNFTYYVALVKNDLDLARSKQEQGLALAEEYGFERLEAIFLRNDAYLDIYHQDNHVTQATFGKIQKSRDIFQRFGDQIKVLETEFMMVQFFEKRNEIAKAKSLALQVLQKARERGFARLQTTAAFKLAALSNRLGNEDEGRTLFVWSSRGGY